MKKLIGLCILVLSLVWTINATVTVTVSEAVTTRNAAIEAALGE